MNFALAGAGVYACREATAEFGDCHSAEAVAHVAHLCIGDVVETPTTLPCLSLSAFKV